MNKENLCFLQLSYAALSSGTQSMILSSNYIKTLMPHEKINSPLNELPELLAKSGKQMKAVYSEKARVFWETKAI